METVNASGNSSSLLLLTIRQFLPCHFIWITNNAKIEAKSIPIITRIRYRMFQRVFILASLSAFYMRVSSIFAVRIALYYPRQ